jgi:hypothetical protein
MAFHLGTRVKIVQALTIAAGATASTDVEGTAIDMSGFDGVLMVVQLGPLTTGGTFYISAQGSVDSAFSSPIDIAGTKQAIDPDADDNKVLYIDILRQPATHRYLRVHIDRATQAGTFAAMYYLYGPRSIPVTHGTGVAGETFKDVAAGSI